MRAVNLCTDPTCDELVRRPGRCARHRARRPKTAARGYGARWQRIRKRFLRHHPVCSWPHCTAPATDVDHIDGDPRNCAESNLRAYCHPHHSKRTARDQPGGWAKR